MLPCLDGIAGELAREVDVIAVSNDGSISRRDPACYLNLTIGLESDN